MSESIIVRPIMVMPAAMILLVLRCHTADGTAVWCILAGALHGAPPPAVEAPGEAG